MRDRLDHVRGWLRKADSDLGASILACRGMAPPYTAGSEAQLLYFGCPLSFRFIFVDLASGGVNQ